MEEPTHSEAKGEIERRRQAIASELMQLLDDPTRGELSREQVKYLTVLYGLVHQTVTAHSQLWDSAAEDNVMYCAFNNRNLLELLIWSEYCCMSLENGLRFADDAVRDYAGGVLAAQQMAAGWGDQKSLEGAEQLLANHAVRARALGIDPEDCRFLRVNAAAKELGPEAELSFKCINNSLSKFVHPTAFVVNHAAFHGWEEFSRKAVSEMFASGVSFANTILNRIAARVVSMKAGN